MATVSTIARRVSALTCVAALVSGQAFASDPNEFTLAPQIQAQPYVAPAPQVEVYTPAPTDVYIETAPAPEVIEYVEPQVDPEPVYVIQETTPVVSEPVAYTPPAPEPVVYTPAPEPVVISQPAPVAPAPQPVVYSPPPAPVVAAPAPVAAAPVAVAAAPAGTAVAAPVGAVGGLSSGGLGGAGLIAAGVGAAALIGIAVVALSDDDDSTNSTTGTQ